MSLGSRKVDKAPFGEHVDAAAVGSSNSSTNSRTSRVRRARSLIDGISTSTLKWPVLARMAPSRMRFDVLAGDDALVAGRRDEDLARLGRARHRHDLETVHDCLERLQRIDLGDDHVRAHALGPRGDSAAAPAVPGDDQSTPREQNVRRAQDAVQRRLAGAVAVVEQMLGQRLVDGDDRIGELALGLERLQPDHAGRRLLGAADDL